MYTEVSLAMPVPSAFMDAYKRGRSNSTPNPLGYACNFELECSECSSPNGTRKWMHRLRKHRKSAPVLKKIPEMRENFLTVENEKHRRSRSPSVSPLLLRKLTRKLSLSHEITLQWAVENEDVHSIKKLLSDSQENINELKAPGITPLHQACAVGNIEIVQLLVENGANLHMKTENNLSPLQIAVMAGNYEVGQYLVNHGADSDDIKNGF